MKSICYKKKCPRDCRGYGHFANCPGELREKDFLLTARDCKTVRILVEDALEYFRGSVQEPRRSTMLGYLKRALTILRNAEEV
jgi:hypothetical protein